MMSRKGERERVRGREREREREVGRERLEKDERINYLTQKH